MTLVADFGFYSCNTLHAILHFFAFVVSVKIIKSALIVLIFLASPSTLDFHVKIAFLHYDFLFLPGVTGGKPFLFYTL